MICVYLVYRWMQTSAGDPWNVPLVDKEGLVYFYPHATHNQIQTVMVESFSIKMWTIQNFIPFVVFFFFLLSYFKS